MQYIPCSGLTGENLRDKATEPALTERYKGPTLMEIIGRVVRVRTGHGKPGKSWKFSFALWYVVSMCLILSHGQASIGRGFSVNRHMEVDNLNSHSLINLRAVYDYIKYVGGIENITISKALLVGAAAGRQKYHAYLDEQKRKEEKAKKKNKRKGMLDELEELKAKRTRLQNDIKSLQQSADKYANKAESTGQVT